MEFEIGTEFVHILDFPTERLRGIGMTMLKKIVSAMSVRNFAIFMKHCTYVTTYVLAVALELKVDTEKIKIICSYINIDIYIKQCRYVSGIFSRDGHIENIRNISCAEIARHYNLEEENGMYVLSKV